MAHKVLGVQEILAKNLIKKLNHLLYSDLMFNKKFVKFYSVLTFSWISEHTEACDWV